MSNVTGTPSRRKSRELVLAVLYAREIREDTDMDALIDHVADEHAYDNNVRNYARRLAKKAAEVQKEMDGLIRAHAANWDLGRMAAVDRNILRMSVTELKYFPDIPFRVIIDEAVEIAKKYGTADSGRFVNGVIDSIYKEIATTHTASLKGREANGKHTGTAGP